MGRGIIYLFLAHTNHIKYKYKGRKSAVKLSDRVEKYRGLILDSERYLWKNPEPGYKEFKTNEYMLGIFKRLGYEVTPAEGVTGFFVTQDTGRAGPTLLILAELDSLINRSHPESDPETGAVHSCGHHIQCAAMVGVAAALAEEGALEGLCGRIKLCLVPAEEGIEIGYRKSLIEKGVIKYTSGKTEFISRGYFSDVDIAFMVHAGVATYEGERFHLSIGHNGVVRKCSIFKGKAAHAGAHPERGINALNAATSALSAANSLRETFRECDYFRFHSIITKGGDSVNAVPDEVIVESYVRAASSRALAMANEKINRAFSACAAAFGATLEINDMPGSEPLREDLNLRDAAAEVLEELVGKDGYSVSNEWTASSTDMGDVSSIVPAIHAYVRGSSGTMHGKDYAVVDPELSCCENAKFQLALIEKLLSDGAARAKDIISKYTPVFKSLDEYIAHKNSMQLSRNTVEYKNDGTVVLNYKD